MRNKRDVYLDNRPWEEALEGLLRHLESVGSLGPGAPEEISAEEGLGRVTAEPIFARNSSPHYNASAMDGIAVDSALTFGASDANPIHIQLGDKAQVVDTGDPIPAGCDAVIMIEDVHFVEEEIFEITSAAAPWQHVRAIGEDVVATEMILPANHQIRPMDVGGILAGGVARIKVHPKPKVALLPTGTELVQPGTELKAGDIVEYNTRVFGSLVRTWGGEPLRWPITIDNWDQLKETILKAVEQADVVVINAGSSAGREDFTAELIRELGTVVTHGVAIKPGKPVILGEVQGKPVIGVPGYPVSAYLTMELFVRPVVYRKLGSISPSPKTVEAIISRKMPSPMGVEEFIRVKMGQVGDKIIATPISRGAGVIMSLVRADGMLRVPRLSEGFRAGETAPVELMRSLEEINQTTVVIGSHDMSLDVLANHLRRKFPEASLSSANVGSLGGLSAIKRGECHCSGTHLLDEETGEYNVSYVKRLMGDRPVVLVNLVYRQQGLMVAKGNPLGIKGLEDLAREGIRFINRQRGAGTRILLDFRLKQLNLDPESIYGYNREEYTHMAVAAAVASGGADAALGILAAANALDLDFVPVVEERYDLCIPGEYWETPYIQRLLEVIAAPEFRQQVEELGGYDLRDCGGVMYRQGV